MLGRDSGSCIANQKLPLTIRMHASDNVAIVANDGGLAAGSVLPSGLVLRERSCDDKRSFFVRLTPAGDQVFCDVFPKVIARGKELFTAYSDADFARVLRSAET